MEHQWNMDHKKQVISGGCHPSSFPFPSLPGQCDGHLGGHWSEPRLGPSKRDVWKMDGCVIFPSHVLYNYIISWNITHDHPIIIYYYGWLVVTGTMEFWMTSHSVGNGITISSDELIFFRGVETTNQMGWTSDELWFHNYPNYIPIISHYYPHLWGQIMLNHSSSHTDLSPKWMISLS